MSETLLRSWWLLGLRGTIALLFGVAAILWPAITLFSLAVLFTAFALLAGTVWIFGAMQNRKHDQRWWVMLLLGAFSVGAGIIAALNPGLTTVALILLMGANALVSGVLDIIVAVRLRKYMKGELLLALSGIASIIFGLVVLMFPTGAGALALAWMAGLYAIVSGALLLALALQVRSWSRINGGRSSGPAGAV